MQHLHLQDDEKIITLENIGDIPVPSINELDVRINVSSAAATASNDGVGHKMNRFFSFI